jgi:hypothetical protein
MRHLTLGFTALLAAALVTQVAQAFPSRGGNCSYCHTAAAGQLDVTGNQTEETVTSGSTTTTYKTFVVEPGGTTQFTLTAVSKGDGRYAIILNRLDLLNETVQYSPRLYTPDATWSSSRSNGDQYLGGQGRYYSTAVTDVLNTYLFNLGVGPLVKPGFYTIQARMAGGNPDADPRTDWNVLNTFGLRVIPEPASAALLMLGFVPLFARRFGR